MRAIARVIPCTVLLGAALLWVPATAYAQEATMGGTVTDSKSKNTNC